VSWQCPSCGYGNDDSTLACYRCGKVDARATQDELAAWNKLLQRQRAVMDTLRVWLFVYSSITLLAIAFGFVAIAQFRHLVQSQDLFDSSVDCVLPSGSRLSDCDLRTMQVVGVKRTYLKTSSWRGIRVRSWSEKYRLLGADGRTYSTSISQIGYHMSQINFYRGQEIEGQVWRGALVRLDTVDTDDSPDSRVAYASPDVVAKGGLSALVIVICGFSIRAVRRSLRHSSERNKTPPPTVNPRHRGKRVKAGRRQR
jgi:hypothetical protein